MNRQQQLVEILKSKGIGPKGSKKLDSNEIADCLSLLIDKNCQLTTKATFLTALLLLDKSEEETKLVDDIIANKSALPTELEFLVSQKAESLYEKTILSLIEKNDLSQQEASESIGLFMDKNTPDYLQACFLEGLRLKRETDTENAVFYNYFLKESKRQFIDIEPIIEIGDSFDGVERNFNFDLFVGCVLASMGYKVLLTGCETVAPKNGLSHHQILKEAGKNPLISMEKAKEQLQELGICYLDQEIFHPELSAKVEMRQNMVKRPFLATFEKILSPICSKSGNYLATSYTHAHYKNANIEIFKQSKFINKALNIKGLEGTIQPKANISTPVLIWDTKEVTELNYKFSGDLVMPENIEINAENTLKLALDYFENNTENCAKQYIKNTVALLLLGFGLGNNLETIFSNIDKQILNKNILNIWRKINE
jgi:anthranilate phosphoribosyltransferase